MNLIGRNSRGHQIGRHRRHRRYQPIFSIQIGVHRPLLINGQSPVEDQDLRDITGKIVSIIRSVATQRERGRIFVSIVVGLKQQGTIDPRGPVVGLRRDLIHMILGQGLHRVQGITTSRPEAFRYCPICIRVVITTKTLVPQ